MLSLQFFSSLINYKFIFSFQGNVNNNANEKSGDPGSNTSESGKSTSTSSWSIRGKRKETNNVIVLKELGPTDLFTSKGAANSGDNLRPSVRPLGQPSTLLP